MENSVFMIFIGGLVVTALLVGGGVFNLKRHDAKAMKAHDSLAATANRVWAYLIPKQQEELNAISSLLHQEEWVEQNVEPSVLGGVSAERILVELANRGLVILGKGSFRRHSTAIDFIAPTTPVTEDHQGNEENDATSPATDIVPSETITEKRKNMDAAATPKKDLPVILLNSETCKDCVHISQEFQTYYERKNPGEN